MRVKAIEPGFYVKLREIGEEFDVEDGEKASWFVKVDTESGNDDGGGQTKPARQARSTPGGQTKPADSSTGRSADGGNHGSGSQ
ncbi:hypothetical protein [Achromobacter sp.]|uniref:hypothetical protein n=1 Tax=Achromobacter sp. TaxID=134375 RepID=UPI000EDD85C1|nr:hypothetical protein [Achromobacter sp.]HCW16863.1 hypothetical protein [Achromobacter sp.]